ncbi:MAG: serine/threonine-protein kinase [Planctomycetaceae bacterium]
MPESAQQILDSILDQQRHLLMTGQRPSVESLLAGSTLESDREAQLDLVYNEVVVLEELGENPVIDDYLVQFPHLEQDLKVHFEIHRAVNGSLLSVTDPDGYDTWPADELDASFSPGMKFGDYSIVEQIGHGGMGIVYRAHDDRLHRDVALKMFQPNRPPTQRESQRFQVEAEAMARLAHPNIIPIFEIGNADGRPFLALELAPRGTLAQQLQLAVYAPRDAASLLESLARAVHHAHEYHVVHRDLKPANVLFANDGTPKLTDFGLAKVMEDDFHSSRDATRSGESVGTPRYMAPEQAAGETELIGPATDIYSLGTLLYECLTGQVPFVSTSVLETLQRIRFDDPASPRRLQRGIPRDLETICLRCLEKDPQRRYPSALALAEDLRRFRCGEPILARPISVWERGWKWSRRRPAHATLIAICALGSLTALAAITIGKQAEAKRIERLRIEVTGLVNEGQAFMEQGDADVASGRFQEAWLIVNREPALSDFRLGIGGWLDHSHRAVNQRQWQQRLPPLAFDERRDLALLESLLLDPKPEDALQSALDSIHAALELTIQDDPAWQNERERLLLVEADLIQHEKSAAAALPRLDAASGLGSNALYQSRARLLDATGKEDEANRAREMAATFPVDKALTLMLTGMRRIRAADFQHAASDFEEVLNFEPEYYLARLFHSICFLNMKRPGEAEVGLTACIAQRPRLYWNYFLRSQAYLEQGKSSFAVHDLKMVLELKPPFVVRSAAESLLRAAQSKITRSDHSPSVE